MGKHNLLIEYANNRKVYAPGDVVDGSVVLDLKKPKKIKKIKVNTIGESIVKLKHENKQLRSREKYFEYSFDVYQGNECELTAGQHKFPFRFQLKLALPTSYEGNLGHVRYSIQAVVEYPGLLSSKTKCVSAFTVLDTVDLNTTHNARQAQRMFCEKRASGMCCWRKPGVSATITTQKSAFVPGEFIIVNGIIANGRSKPLKKVNVDLYQQVTFNGRYKNSPLSSPLIAHTVTNSVANWNIGDKTIAGGSTDNWENKSLMQIPPLIPTGLKGCNLIDVQYFLRITVEVPGRITGTEITGRSNYVTIGTVPLMSQLPPPRPPLPAMPQVQQHVMTGIATAPPPEILATPPPDVFQVEPAAPPPYDPGNSQLATVPLPSYEEAVTGGASLSQDAQGENEEVVTPDAQFTPQYTFYDFSQPAYNPAFATAPPSG